MSKYMQSYRLFSKILGLIGIISLASCSSTQGFYDADGIYTDRPMKVDKQPVDYATYFDEMKQEADSYAYIIDSEDYFSQSEPNRYGGWGEQAGDTNIYFNNNWGWNWGFGYGFYYGWADPYFGWGYPGFGWGWGYPYYWHTPYYWGWGYPRYAYRDVSRSSFHRNPGRTVYSPATNSLRQTRTLRSRDLTTSRTLNSRSRNIDNSRNQTVRRPVSRNTINRSDNMRQNRNSETIQRNTNRNFSPSRSINTGGSRSTGGGISRGSGRSR